MTGKKHFNFFSKNKKYYYNIMNIIVIPREIAQDALITIIPCVLLGIYASLLTGHIHLAIVYGLLSITSVLYWTNTDWENIMYIDMTLAFVILSLKTYIAVKHFTPFFIYLWAITLFIMCVSFMLNREILMRKVYPADKIDKSIVGDLIDNYCPIKYAEIKTKERTDAYKDSTQMHMITMHLIATLVFISGLYVSYKNF